MSFITTKVDIVGSFCESEKTVSLGYDEKSLSEVKGLLEEIAEILIYSHTASVSQEKVEEVFFEL